MAMKILTSWTVRPGAVKEAVSRFAAGKAAPPAGLKILGRWYRADGSGGFGLYEADSAAAYAEFAAMWTDLLEIHESLVIDEAEFGAVVTKVFGK
jgi:hypothetical protein